MLRAVLIDDEILALKLLEMIVKEIEGIEVIGVFTNPVEGLEEIHILKPDVLFLDINMPNMTGLTVAEKIMHLPTRPEVVFVSAYDQYALQAYNVEAIDYILKPIEKLRVEKTLQRILKNRRHSLENVQEAEISAQFLGSFQLFNQHGQWFKWRTKKSKELAAYLIYHNSPIHRHRMMEELWPDMSIDKAATLLHTTIYQLRKKLKECGFEDAVVFKDERYSLNIKIESDVKKLKFYIEKKDIEKVLEIYTEGFLSYDDYVWSHQEAERIRNELINCLEGYVFNTAVPAVPTLKRALIKLHELDPWEERYLFEMVKLYVEQGNVSEAKKTINQYQKNLRREIDIDPRKDFILELEKLVLESASGKD